jgi:Cu+-exporting ATPase
MYLDFGIYTVFRKGSSSQVNFPEKVRITYNSENVSLSTIIYLLSAIGWAIHILTIMKRVSNVNRTLTYKLGVAFFCFGNIMLLSFQRYFDINEFWLDS